MQPDEVQAQIEALHPAGEQPLGDGEPGMTTQGKESITLAVQEARSLGHHYIGTEHLLLGLLREERESGGQVLRKSGVTLEKARELIAPILGRDKSKRLIETVFAIETMTDLRRLRPLLQRG